MLKIFILLLLSSCSSSSWDAQDLAYNKCATTCSQQGSFVEQSSLNDCSCGAKNDFQSLQAIP